MTAVTLLERALRRIEPAALSVPAAARASHDIEMAIADIRRMEAAAQARVQATQAELEHRRIVSQAVRRERMRRNNLGARNSRAKFTADEVREIRRRHAAGETLTSIAEDCRTSPQNVSRIVKRLSWKHVP